MMRNEGLAILAGEDSEPKSAWRCARASCQKGRGVAVPRRRENRQPRTVTETVPEAAPEKEKQLRASG